MYVCGGRRRRSDLLISFEVIELEAEDAATLVDRGRLPEILDVCDVAFFIQTSDFEFP